MCPTCHRIEVWHEAIAQTVVIDKGLIGGVIVGSNVPDLAQRPLTMRAEQRDKGAELIPACLQLTPLLQILVLLTCAVEELLGSDITVLHTEAALVHAPERQAGDGVVESCGHLGTHILPTGTDVTTPGGGREALFTSKAATGEQEYAWLIRLTLPDRTLTIVDGIGIHGAVGIEIFG